MLGPPWRSHRTCAAEQKDSNQWKGDRQRANCDGEMLEEDSDLHRKPLARTRGRRWNGHELVRSGNNNHQKLRP